MDNSLTDGSLKISQDDKEDIRVALQTYVQILASESAKPWNAISIFIQFSAALMVGAIAPSFIPQGNETLFALVAFISSLIGFTASVIWLAIDRRYQMISKYWLLSIRELENQLSDKVQAIQR